MKIYNVLDIAAYLINYAIDEGNPISNLKLQKLLYYIQGEFYKEKDQPAFKEDILAWDYGPVVKEAYDEYKININKDIKKRVEEKFDIESFDYINFNPEDIICKEDGKIIREIYNRYKDFTAFDLVEKTHNEAPWESTKRSDIIEKCKIREYFKDEISLWEY
ncbi:Panacea domain-containing protein [Miniphocaeibacter massiliensis]|uniref:Panacea domain-containing protein n=1 Tax=Miniphocaeibacter massiliensis TaxID=2041841 RepID=UPI000C1BD1C1|nr:type II toxin-antitoxin system antitoxin SocA domain-containing protein [Miniphocaeibacter massiliensis]